MINWSRIWRKTYRTMLQALLPFIPINLIMLSEFDIKVMLVEVLGSGLTCFIMAILDEDNAIDIDDDYDECEDEEEC